MIVREYRVFELDKYGNRFFCVSRPSLQLAQSYVKNVLKVDTSEEFQSTAVIQDEYGQEYAA